MNKSNKIGIMTIHNCYNYGASLQAYATYYFLKKIGFENVEIINYENDFEKKSKSSIKFIKTGKGKEKIKRMVQYIIFGKNRHLKKGFKKFNKNLIRSPKVDKDTIYSLSYDILISGSDQIWNPVIFNELDEMFFLNFANNAKKMSISSSAGSYIYNKNEIERVNELLSKYDAISVREISLKEQLQPNLKKEVFVSVDPTLLLDKSEWKKSLNIKKEKNEEEYILLYLVDANINDYMNEIERLKKRINLPIWFITPYKFKYKNIDKNIVSATPELFISLINNSEFVITNSYHGVIFSTNFDKNFFALENHKNPKRTQDYLTSIGLQDRIVKNEEDAKKIALMYDKEKAAIKLKELVDCTKNWIINNLDNM